MPDALPVWLTIENMEADLLSKNEIAVPKRGPGAPKINLTDVWNEHKRRRQEGEAMFVLTEEARYLENWANEATLYSQRTARKTNLPKKLRQIL